MTTPIVRNTGLFQNPGFMTWLVAGAGLGCWAIVALGGYLKWAWSEPVDLKDLGLLVLFIAAGAILLRTAEDVNRTLKARKLVLPDQAPEPQDPKRFRVMGRNMKLRLITGYTDVNGLNADPLIVIERVIRIDGDVWLEGKVDRKPAAIPLAAVNKIKDVETNVVVHDDLRQWLNQRLDGWTGKSGELNADIIAKAEKI